MVIGYSLLLKMAVEMVMLHSHVNVHKRASGWWLSHPSEKYDWDHEIPAWKKKNIFPTTNQSIIFIGCIKL